MRTRQKSKSELMQRMQERLAASKLVIPGETARMNPLAVMDDAEHSGPVFRLLEAWAIVGEVLTFYQQRIADERALSTAREDFSAYAIARGMGYDPRPAVSAQTTLAFAVKDPSGRMTVPKQTAIGNIPAPGKRPAIFETSTDLDAYADWNRVAAAVDAAPVPAVLETGATRLRLRGTAPIASGSAMVIRVRNAPAFTVIVADTLVDIARDTTVVRWTVPLANAGGEQLVDVSVLETRVRPYAALAPLFRLAPPPDRRPYVFGGVAVRRDGVWARASEGLDSAPVALALTRSGWYGITATQFVRRAPGDAAWTTSAPFAGGILQTVVATPGGRLAVGTTTGSVFVSVDDGLTWAAAGPNRLPAVPVHAIAIDERHESPVLYVATDRGIASLTLNGDAWIWRNDGLPGTDPKTGFASAAATSLAFTDSGATLLAATTYGVFRSTNGGPWTRVPGVGSVAHVASAPGGRLIVAGPGGVFGSSDGALTWDPLKIKDEIPRALAVNVANVVVALGSAVYASDDGGATWTEQIHGLQSKPAALAVAPDGTIAAAAPFVENPADDWPAHPNWPRERPPAIADSLTGLTLQIDRELPLRPGDDVVVSCENDDGVVAAFRIVAVQRSTARDYGITVTSTAMTLDQALESELRNLTNPRKAVVHVNPRARAVVPVAAAHSAAPTTTLPIPRDLRHLVPGRNVAIEGRAARVMLRGLAGGPVWIPADGGYGGAPPPALIGLTQQPSGAILPVLDVEAATAVGDRGIALARFDGVWACDDVTAAPAVWTSAAAPPVEPCSLASHGEKLYACGPAHDAASAPAGIYACAASSWQPIRAGTFTRLVVAANTLWACGERGLYALADGAFTLADPAFAGCAVHDVAGDETTLIAATDDGVYVRRGAAWEKAAGFPPHVATAVAIGGDAWYAGTRGRGTLVSKAGSGTWAPVDPEHRSGDVRALCAVGGAVFAAERGRGLARRGVPTGVPLASGTISFVPLTNQLGGGVLAFRGVPCAAGAPTGIEPAALRTYLGMLPLDRDDLAMLDAGALPATLQRGLEERAQVKLDVADLVVESAGRAWRLDANPVVLVRLEPAARVSVFEVGLRELAAPPAKLKPAHDPFPGLPQACMSWTLRAKSGDARLFACTDDVWYAPAATDADVQGETAVVASHDPAELTLSAALAKAYDPRTVTIAGNIVVATHGASIPAAEQIASGDSSKPAQTAKLVEKPLTNLMGGDGVPRPDLNVWVRAKTVEDPFTTTAALAQTELGLEWNRVKALPKKDGRARAYVVRQNVDGVATLTFGDGERGRRLPTGDNNVVARYRIGGGADGNVARATLTLFQRMLPGFERVWNPVAATGGVATERVADLADVRRTVSRRLVSLGRIVCMRDLEDFIGAWPGIEKVDVKRIRTASPSFLVTIAVAGDVADGASAAADTVPPKLHEALRQAGAGGWHVDVRPYRARTFAVKARLYAGELPDRGERVKAAAASALAVEFGWTKRALREDVRASAVVAILQRIPDVVAVTLDALHEVGTQPSFAECIIGNDLDADAAASLLTIDPALIALDVVTLGDPRAAGQFS